MRYEMPLEGCHHLTWLSRSSLSCSPGRGQTPRIRTCEWIQKRLVASRVTRRFYRTGSWWQTKAPACPQGGHRPETAVQHKIVYCAVVGQRNTNRMAVKKNIPLVARKLAQRHLAIRSGSREHCLPVAFLSWLRMKEQLKTNINVASD